MSDDSRDTEGKKKILLETQNPRDLPFKASGPGPAEVKMKTNSKRKPPEGSKTDEESKQ